MRKVNPEVNKSHALGNMSLNGTPKTPKPGAFKVQLLCFYTRQSVCELR